MNKTYLMQLLGRGGNQRQFNLMCRDRLNFDASYVWVKAELRKLSNILKSIHFHINVLIRKPVQDLRLRQIVHVVMVVEVCIVAKVG